MSPVDSKWCPKCQTTKAAPEFSRCNTSKSGLQGWCRECHRAKYAEDKSNTEFYRALTPTGLAAACKHCKNATSKERAAYRAGKPAPPAGHKRCSSCNETKALAEFYRHPRDTAARLTFCTQCVEARRSKRDAERPDKQRAYSLQRNYGLTVDQYTQWVEACGYTCEICGYEMPREAKGAGERLHVDHDHETEALRGLLCNRCNTGLGQFRDNPSLLYVAAEYLEEHALHAEYFQYPWESSANPTVDLLGPAVERHPALDLLTDEEMLDLI